MTVNDLSIISKRYPRIDAKDKVTGKAKYIDDYRFSGMLYGRILRSPYPHARVLKIDFSRAQRMTGVRAVVTAQDTPKKKYGSYRSGAKDELIFASDRVRYVGDEVAAVAAIDEDIAREALSLIRVEYEELPAVFSVRDARSPRAPRIHDEAEENVASHTITVRGDPVQGFRAADIVLEEEFDTGL